MDAEGERSSDEESCLGIVDMVGCDIKVMVDECKYCVSWEYHKGMTGDFEHAIC